MASSVVNHEISIPNIPDFYRNKSIFITGGSGFMGKVLVERLLATCPDISKIYLLLREKKGITPDERLQQLKESPVFDILRAKIPHQLDKMVALSGDLTKTQLGLTEKDLVLLKEVSVVFHVGALINLQASLKKAVDNNLLPTIALLELCDRFPKLEAFIYVSTTFSNSELKRVEEKVYPPPMNLNSLLDIVEHQKLNEVQEKRLTGSKPNNYVFSKAMAEYVVQKHGCSNFPVAIFRPAVLISSYRQPFPGWIENMNGPSGVIAGVSTGILKVFRNRKEAKGDLVPIDITIDNLIAVGWEVALDRPADVRVYNCSEPENQVLWRDFMDIVNKNVVKYPSNNAIWYPHLSFIENRFLYWSLEMVLQTIPAHALEYTSKFLFKNPGFNFINANEKIKAMNTALCYFSTNEWHFANENMKKLSHRLSPTDKALLTLELKNIDLNEVLANMVKGTRKYVLKQSDDSLNTARARVRKLGYIRTAVKGASLLIGLKILSETLQ